MPTTSTVRRSRSWVPTSRKISFAGSDPIGQEIRADGVPYTIIGISEKQGKTFGQSQDNWVAVPLNSYQKTYGTMKTLTMYIKGGDAKQMEAAEDEARVLMRNRRHVGPGIPDDFNIDTNDTFLDIWKSISAGFEAVAVAIASISPKDHQQNRRPNDVELLLDTKRPKVEQRIFGSIRREIAGLTELKQVGCKSHAGGDVFPEQGKIAGQKNDPADQIARNQYDDERRKYSANSARIEPER